MERCDGFFLFFFTMFQTSLRGKPTLTERTEEMSSGQREQGDLIMRFWCVRADL